MMKYVFFGTPRFAAIVLEELIRGGIPPAAVVCNPDRPAGRKKAITPPPTKALAVRHGGIAVFQPEEFNENFIKQIKDLQADLFIVAAYAKIIPKAILDVPRLGTVGVHPSLLPKYRGASPIQSAILAGDRETGVSVYHMDEKMDHGPVIMAEPCPISGNEGYLALEERLAKLAGTMLMRLIPAFLAARLKPQAQDEARATYTKKFKTEDAFVDERDLAAAEQGEAQKAAGILRMMNALNPEPGAWTIKNGKRMKLLGAELRNGALRLTRTQNEGEAPKPA